ncbi:hypothetical protein C8Q75DRAFT_735647 [Abortiporus biennis]|nr:hypothetical protein C8Q75DRAFT_735647 [Abortiporus biennis]
MAQGGPELSTEVGDVIGICWLNSMELTTSQQVALCITVPAVISVISASFELKATEAAKYVQHRYILEKYHAAKDTVEDLMNIEFTPDSLVSPFDMPQRVLSRIWFRLAERVVYRKGFSSSLKSLTVVIIPRWYPITAILVYGELASSTTGWRNVCQKSPLLQFTELCKASVEAPLDSCGVLRPGFEAKTLCEDGHHPDGGEAGDLYLSNSQLTLGYYRDDKATREAFVNGWLQTGDRFRANENAVLYVRTQVSSTEIEDVLLAHPEGLVADASVPGTCQGLLANWETTKSDELGSSRKTATGKTLRRLLQDKFERRQQESKPRFKSFLEVPSFFKSSAGPSTPKAVAKQAFGGSSYSPILTAFVTNSTPE